MNIKIASIEKLKDNEYLVQYFAENQDYIVSFLIEDNITKRLHIENIDRLGDIESIEKAYDYFYMIEEDLIKIIGTTII